MKKQLPLLLGFLVGTFAFLQFYTPHPGAHWLAGFLFTISQVIAAAAYFLGAINVIQVNLPHISRRHEDWQYKVVLVVSALAMTLSGIAWHNFGGKALPGTVTIDAVDPAFAEKGKAFLWVRSNRDRVEISVNGAEFEKVGNGLYGAAVEPGEYFVGVRSFEREVGYAEYNSEPVTLEAGQTATFKPRISMLWGPDGRVFMWLYEHIFTPCNQMMFALLAFFIASAAFRAFRARNVEAALLLGAAMFVLIGRVPIGRVISPIFPSIADWMVEVPNNAGRRALIMGAALGAIATSLRVILGLERSHLGKD